MQLKDSEMDFLYALVRLEATRLHVEHGTGVLDFELGSWGHSVIALEAKLSVDFHRRRKP